MMTIERPSWDSYFFSVAFLISARSRDEETKHGTVIVDNNNLILGTGYNSFLKGIDDSKLPTKRPGKYPYMIHSELNAILNCRVLPREAGGGKAYVTGRCCNQCLQSLIQAGVSQIYMANRKGSQLEDKNTLEIFDTIIEETKTQVHFIDYDLKWIEQVISYYKQ